MGELIIISKYVWSTWSGTNVAHYEELGYKLRYDRNYYPIYHLRVLPQHLLPNSKTKVEVECPDCGGTRKVRWRDIVLFGHTSCSSCSAFRSNPNLTQEDREKLRFIPNYEAWRSGVLERDNYTCQCCGENQGAIIAHHINSYKHHPKLRTEIDNGVALCKPCHDDFHLNFMGGTRVKCTRKDYDAWRESK